MKRWRNTIVAAIFAGLSLWFWIVLSPGTLRFLETTQFFPYTWTHLREALSYPGGIAVYISEFAAQFFLFSVPAGIIVTLAFLILQQLSWRLISTFCQADNDTWYPLSFIPAFCAWAYLCVFGNMFSGIVAVCAALGAANAYVRSRNTWAAPIMALMLYYVAGPAAYVFVAICIIDIIRRKSLSSAASTLAAVGLMASVPLLCSFFVQYTTKELYLGINIFNQPEIYTATWYVLAFSTPVACILATVLPRKISGAADWACCATLAIAVFAGGWFYMIKNCNPIFERIYEYDKMACNEDWDGILARGLKTPPASQAEATAIDLALAMKGTLLTDMFKYFQPGFTALFPDYAQGYIVTLTAGESVFRAGLLNTARHYAYEEYESYPNFKVSSRFMKRIAEIDLINGNYKLARRYLKDLSHTLFYSRWARRYLKNPASVAQDMEYARLMQYVDSSDFLYSDTSDDDKREMLRRMVGKTGKYDVPAQYLIAYDLLAKDLYSLRSDIKLIDFGGEIPPLVQQAAVMFSSAFEDVTDEELALASQETVSRYADFHDALATGKTPGFISGNFGTTYWYYYSSKR